MFEAKITGVGAYLPQKILTNHALEKIVDTSHQWIVERSGIHERRIAADDETVASMAHLAAIDALTKAQLSPQDIDLIIVATCSSTYTFPSAACELQTRLGAQHAFAFDVSAACSGFIYALVTAWQYIAAGNAKHVLVVGSEIMSRVVDWQDRSTCVLFGDGAGAVVLSRAETPGILGFDLHTDGALADILYLKRLQNDAKLMMQGREVFKCAVERLVSSSRTLLEKCALKAADIDWVVPHQANLRIIRMVVNKLKLDPEKVIVTLDKQANTSAASIPLALAAGIEDGRIKRGESLLLEAFGGGIVWGGLIVRY